MLDYNGKTYEVAYGVKRLTMAEQMCGKPMLDVFDRAPSLGETLAFLACGLRYEGSGGWLNPREAQQTAEGMLETLGFPAVYREIEEAIERDCGFLSRGIA